MMTLNYFINMCTTITNTYIILYSNIIVSVMLLVKFGKVDNKIVIIKNKILLIIKSKYKKLKDC